MSRSNTGEKDDLFRWADQLPHQLWDDLKARPAREAAVCVGAMLEDSVFKVPLLGFQYGVDTDRCRIQREGHIAHRVSYQTGIVLLTVLTKSMGVPPSGRMVTPRDLEGGRMFFSGAHSLAIKPLIDRFGSNPQGLIERAADLGGEPVSGADYAVRVPALPMLPLYVLIWTGTDGDGIRAIIGIDDRALFHLDLAGVFALTNIMVNRLVHVRP